MGHATHPHPHWIDSWKTGGWSHGVGGRDGWLWDLSSNTCRYPQGSLTVPSFMLSLCTSLRDSDDASRICRCPHHHRPLVTGQDRRDDVLREA